MISSHLVLTFGRKVKPSRLTPRFKDKATIHTEQMADTHVPSLKDPWVSSLLSGLGWCLTAHIGPIKGSALSTLDCSLMNWPLTTFMTPESWKHAIMHSRLTSTGQSNSSLLPGCWLSSTYTQAVFLVYESQYRPDTLLPFPPKSLPSRFGEKKKKNLPFWFTQGY